LPLQFAAETGRFGSTLKRLSGDMRRTSITGGAKTPGSRDKYHLDATAPFDALFDPWPCFARERAPPYKTASAPRECLYAPGFHTV
jgi:hypothetical protein